MAQSLIACPLCSAASFSNTNTLCLSLISVASKWLRCTMCEEELKGLDKFTIHLLGHLIHTSDFKRLLEDELPDSGEKGTFMSQPLNLVKSKNDSLCQDLIKKPASVDSCSLQNDNRNERPSLKIDNEVMIFFNSKHPNTNLEVKNSEINLIRALDRERPSSSGLPKFTINFDKTGNHQSKNIVFTEKTNMVISTDYFDSQSENESSPYIFPVCNNNEGSVNNKIVSCQDSDSQMEVSANDKEKEISNCLAQLINTSNTMTEDSPTLLDNDTKTHTSNKSSFLSPKGERVFGFRCDICSLVFPDENILSMHRQLIHTELKDSSFEPSSYKCHLCSKSFVMKGSLMVHMRVAHFGGAVVARLLEAKQLETDAVSPDSAQFTCSICNKGFRKEQQLAQHEKLHDGKQCDVCFKTFTTKYFLRKHKRLHTGEMPYQCTQCNKSFTFQQSYHKHLLYHSDDKPYTCGECGRAFKELSTLHNHQRIHTGERPFACETCGKCFRQRVSYLVHRRIHTGAMPYRCQDCGKTFRYKVSERTHKCNISTAGSSSDALNPPTTETNQTSVFVSNDKNEVQSINEMIDQGSTIEALQTQTQQEPMNEIYPEHPDFFSLVMSPSDKLQHLSLTSDPTEETSTHSQNESIDTEALKQLLYDVADYT